MIELMVVTGIIILVTGVIFANNNRFGGMVFLQNLAYDIALSIRQAQVYGISVARSSAGTYGAGYGVHFDLANPTTYVTFADLSGDGLYECTTPGTPDCELTGSSAINRGYKIAQLCATPLDGSEVCGTVDDAEPAVSSIDVLFKRPEPDAYIAVDDTPTFAAGAVVQSALHQSARIVLISPRGDEMSVVVWNNGQISVQK